MAIDQALLLQESIFYYEKRNQEFYPGSSLVPVPKRRIFIGHALESFRMVEGFIVLMQKAGIEAYFDWESGNFTDEFSRDALRDLKNRIARCEVYLFLSTEQSLASSSCLKSLEFATLINRKVYDVQTFAGDMEFFIRPNGKYSQLAVERTHGTRNYRIRVLDKQYTKLWVPITNVSQL